MGSSMDQPRDFVWRSDGEIAAKEQKFETSDDYHRRINSGMVAQKYTGNPYIGAPHWPNTNITFAPQGKQVSDGSSTDYYKLPENIKDLIDLIEYRNMNFAIGNIFKACYRLGQKEGNDDLYDLRKIKFFVEREIARLEKNNRITP